jgi:hypothetical protein
MMFDVWTQFLIFIPVFYFMFFYRPGLKRACPECNASLPAFQSPFTKTQRQWVQGGYLCRECGCQTDMAGRRVVKGDSPQWGWVILSISLPAVLLATAIYALTLISAR